MTTTGYTLLGRLVWLIGRRVVRRKAAQNRVKLGAVAVIAAVVLGGIVAARAAGED